MGRAVGPFLIYYNAVGRTPNDATAENSNPLIYLPVCMVGDYYLPINCSNQSLLRLLMRLKGCRREQ